MKKKKKLKKRQRGYAKFDPPKPLKPTTLTTRPRIINICKAYNISTETLISYLNGLGYSNLSNTTLLSDDIVSLIEKKFQEDKNAKDVIRGKTQITFVKPKDNSQKVRQPNFIPLTGKAFRQKVLHLESNIFDTQKTDIQYKDFPIIYSHFTDIEAINLCNKMSSSFTRNLCNQFNNQKYNKQLLIYQIHAIASKALRLFGGKMLTFIYGLRSLQFKNKTAFEIKTYDKVIPDFPMITFISNNTSFKISFFLKRNRQTNKLQPDIRLFASKNYVEIGHIDEQGYVLTKLEKFKPQLNLFYEAILNKKIKIYSGVETGNCDLCGRELTHPTSLRIGIGPICARTNNIDTTLYGYN